MLKVFVRYYSAFCHDVCLEEVRRTRAKEIGLGPSSKSRQDKNLYTNSERLTLGCRLTHAWSERVKLYNRQMILPRKTKTYATR
jgi:hypothetical protein